MGAIYSGRQAQKYGLEEIRGFYGGLLETLITFMARKSQTLFSGGFNRSALLCHTEIDMPTESPYTFQFLETATEVLRAVAHPHRLLIIEMLYQQKSMNVTEVYERLGIEQAVASHHLRILKDRGVVQVRRDGKNSNYSLTSEAYFKILEVLDQVLA